MSHSRPPKSPTAHGSNPPPSSTSSGSMRTGSESSTVGSSSSTPSGPIPPAAKSQSDEASSSALITLINLGLPHLRRLYEALGHLMEEVQEKEMQQRETAHAQELRHRADLHALELAHREELYAKEREQAIQVRNIKEGKDLAVDEKYFTVENDIGGVDVLSKQQFNDRKGREKVGGDEGSGEVIREPADIGLVGGNDFREEDHVRRGNSDTGGSVVEPEQDTAVE